MTTHDRLLEGLARMNDEELAGEASDAGAATLLAEIVSLPAEVPRDLKKPRVRRALLATAAALVLAGGLVFGPAMFETSGEVFANDVVTIDREGDDFVFYVTQPDPDQEDLDRAFKEAGLDVTVRLLAVSPRQVESFVAGGADDPNTRMSISRRECGDRVDRCEISFQIDKAMAGSAVFHLGRPAKTGEKYAVAADATLSGEALAGVDLRGATVREAVQKVGDHHLKVSYALLWPDLGPQRGQRLEENVPAARIDPAWKVAAAETYNDGVIILHVVPGPKTKPPGDLVGE